MPTKEWRDIRGYEGRYQVSNDGEIRNSKGYILKPNSKSPRYHTVRLYNGGRFHYEDRLVHRLVAETFLEIPDDECEANHIDGNRYNNDVSNLEWVSHKENMLHAVVNDLVNTEKAKAAHRKPVRCSNGKTYRSISDAANDLGLNPSCIGDVVRGRYRTSGGYTFEAC